MKRTTLALLEGKTFISNSAGAVRKYWMDDGLIEVLGQATSMRVHGFVFEKTDANARATLKFFESSVAGDVMEKGAQIGGNIDLSALGSTFANVTGPYCGRVMAVLEIDDTVPAAQKKFHMEVGITLILD